MGISKHFFLLISLSIVFLSISLSSAHLKPPPPVPDPPQPQPQPLQPPQPQQQVPPEPQQQPPQPQPKPQAPTQGPSTGGGGGSIGGGGSVGGGGSIGGGGSVGGGGSIGGGGSGGGSIGGGGMGDGSVSGGGSIGGGGSGGGSIDGGGVGGGSIDGGGVGGGGSFSFSGSSNFSGSFSKVFAFGDSFTDTGNAYLLGGLKYSFFGSLISRAFNALNTSGLTGNRQCNGRLVVDFLCDSLSIPYLPPYKQAKGNFNHGANFAIAGATSLAADFFQKLKNSRGLNPGLMWKGIPSSFQTQLDWFQQFVQDSECNGKSANECKGDMENSLFWIGGMGRNDYARTFGSGSTFKIPRLKEMTVAYIYKFLKALTDRGAKYIVVQGLPPVGCCPLELFLTKSSNRDKMGCASIINGIISAHNELLQRMLVHFQKNHPGCTVVYADYWNAFKSLLANYKKYNFEEPFKTCCGSGGGALNFDANSICGSMGTSACKDPSRYINWDGIHFTEAVYKTLTNMFLKEGFCKPPFDQLIKIKQGAQK